MIHFHGGNQRTTRVGVLFGVGSYAYVPFDCRVGRVRALLSDLSGGGAVSGGTLSLLQNGAPLGSALNLQLATPSAAWRPWNGVLPGVTAANLDGAARVSFGLQVSGDVAESALKLSVELLPVDPAHAGAEIWTLYALGDGEFVNRSTPQSIVTIGGADLGIPPLAHNQPVYASGVSHLAENYGGGVFQNPASWHEQAEAIGPGGYQAAGAACPVPVAGTLSRLMVVSADPGGFDGAYTITARRNGTPTDVTVTTPTNGDRIVTSGAATAFYQRGEQFCWELVAASGAELRGHILAVFTPNDAAGDGAGLGAFGLGERGLGG